MEKKSKSSKLIIDQTILEVYAGHIKERNGDIGIEIEAEGAIKFNDSVTGKKWAVKEEHSLRNGGIELATNTPYVIKNIPNVIEQYKELTAGSTFDYTSWRTSVHIHANVQKYTVRQIFSILMAFWMFEDIFCRLNGSGREGNLHCLRLRDADGLYLNIRRDIFQGRFLSRVTQNDFRYAALNLAAIPKFGSVEFRFMRFPENLDDVSIWAETLHKLVTSAVELSWEQVRDMYQAPISEILGKFLPLSFLPWLNRLDRSFIERTIRQHADYAELLTTALLSAADKISKKDYGSEYQQDTAGDSPSPRADALSATTDLSHMYSEAMNNGWNPPPPTWTGTAQMFEAMPPSTRKAEWDVYYSMKTAEIRDMAEAEESNPSAFGNISFVDEFDPDDEPVTFGN